MRKKIFVIVLLVINTLSYSQKYKNYLIDEQDLKSMKIVIDNDTIHHGAKVNLFQEAVNVVYEKQDSPFRTFFFM